MADEHIQFVNLDKVMTYIDQLIAGLQAPQDRRRLFEQIGFKVQDDIKQRTLKGVDAFGGAFKGYSTEYKKFRQAQSHKVDSVNLTWTGGMLGRMTHVASDDQVRIFFPASMARPIRVKAVKKKRGRGKTKPYTIRPKVTESAKAFFLHKDRKFFLLDEMQIKWLQTKIGEWIDKRVKGKDSK